MKKLTKFTAKVIPLPMKNIDTDLIIPAQFMTSVSRDGYGENLFRRLRDNDPNFVFNQDKFKGSEILVADENFGSGSSREHAVWAILGAGIKCVIAKSFADIFFNNSAKNGLLLITLKEAEVEALQQSAASGEYRIEVDLENEEINLPEGKKLKFNYDPFRKHCLLNGLDDIDYLLSHREDIDAFRKKRSEYDFFSATTPNR